MEKVNDSKASVSRRSLLKGLASSTVLGLTPSIKEMAWGAGKKQTAGCGTLTAAIAGYSPVRTLDPAKASLVPEFYIIWAMFNALLKFDEHMKIVPDAAESWKSISDTVWRFHLRSGITFHDGHKMTAEDVKFTIDRVSKKSTGSSHRSEFSKLKEVRVLDPLTLEIETTEPFAPLLSYLTNTRTGSQIVPKHILGEGGSENFGRHPIGTGPYKLDNYKPGISASLSKHKNYFVQGQPYITHLDMPIVPDQTSSVNGLLSGKFDITSTVPYSAISSLTENPKARVLRQPGLNTRFIQMNNRVAPFDDPHFRRALSMALDREILVKAVIYGQGKPSNSIIPSTIPWAHQKAQRLLTQFNLKRAKTELSKSKYGPRQEATVLTWSGSFWKRFAQIFVAQVNKNLGLNFKVEVSQGSAVASRLQSGDYQAASWGWLGLIDPDEYMYSNLHTDGGRNYEGYSNSKVDALLEDARAELNQTQRGKIYQHAEDLVVQDMPLIYCFESYVTNLVSPNLNGFVQLPYGAYGGQFAAVTTC